MGTLDIVLLLPLLWGGYKGFSKGFLMEIVSILAFIIAVIGGFKLLHSGMAYMSSHFEINSKLLPYVSFIAIFVLIVVLVNVLGRVLKKVLDMTLLGSVDNLVGGALGVFKWAFGLSAILWLSASFGLNFPTSWTEDSFLYPLMLNFAPAIVDYGSFLFPFAEGLFNEIKQLLMESTH